jgi:hypothetical protein
MSNLFSTPKVDAPEADLQAGEQEAQKQIKKQRKAAQFQLFRLLGTGTSQLRASGGLGGTPRRR